MLYKIGRILANTGPILKIQNLAYCGERGQSAQGENPSRAIRTNFKVAKKIAGITKSYF